MELGTGEALVSFLDESGAPSVVQRAKMLFPLSSIGPVSLRQREELIRKSPLYGMYEREIDRESAYEIISALDEKTNRQNREKALAEEEEKAQRQRIKEQERRHSARRRSSRSSPMDKIIGSAANTIGRNIGNSLVRSILGSLFK